MREGLKSKRIHHLSSHCTPKSLGRGREAFLHLVNFSAEGKNSIS